MTIDQLRNLQREQPFTPFSVYLADGPAVTVHHPEMMMPSPCGRTVIIYQPDDSFNVIDLLLVTDLEVKPSHKGSNGK